jgi:hypothetical protein
MKATAYIPPHLRQPSSSLVTISASAVVAPSSPDKPPGGCPDKTRPPAVTTAYVRVKPRPDEELEADESINAITYVYENREVTIWESSFVEYPEQQEEDEIARNGILWKHLSPAADWFFCHLDGRRIEAGTVLEHRSRVLIGLRDVVDPDWWHRAMR